MITLPRGLEALPNASFNLPDHWREWLGTARVEKVEECSLYILAKMHSNAPTIFDAEDRLLQRRVGDWLMGLMLVSKFFQLDDPFLASGSRQNGEIDVRHFQALHPSTRGIVDDYAPISGADLRQAAEIAARLEAFNGPWQPDHWRLLRCLAIYQNARSDRDILDRIHQFTRCVEGLIVPKQGDTLKQFKSRTELFVGPRHHDLMGELYQLRSHIEHLHENRYLERFDRDTRIRLAELEAVAEWVARDCLARILLNPALIAHFGSVDALGQFWAMTLHERRAMWGDPIEPLAPLAGFCFNHVSDVELGAHP